MSLRRHIFFDLDHTLWDFERNAFETVSELLHEFRPTIGQSVEPEPFYKIYAEINRKLWEAYERQQITMDGIRNGRWEKAFGEIGIAEDHWMKDFGQHYLDRCPTKPHLMEGAKDVLTLLQEEYTLGIITNGLSENQHTKLNVSGIGPYFSHIVTVDMVGFPKPDPRMFHAALQRAGIQPSDALYIGDTYEADIVGAYKAGLSVIFFNPDDLDNPGGHPQVKHLKDIPSQLSLAWR